MRRFIPLILLLICTKLLFANDFENKVYGVRKGPKGYETLEFFFSDDHLLICDMSNGTYTQYPYDVAGGTIYLGEPLNSNSVDYLGGKTIPYSLKDGTAVLNLLLENSLLTLYDTARKQYRSDLAFGIMDKTAIAATLISGTAYSCKNLKFYKVKEYANSHDGKAPVGYKGGNQFRNDKGALQQSMKNGFAVTYREYDVNPFVKGINRGVERLVIGSNGLAYKTVDHYLSFQLLF